MHAEPARHRHRIDQPRKRRPAGEAEIVALGRGPAAARARPDSPRSRAPSRWAPRPAELITASTVIDCGSAPPKWTSHPPGICTRRSIGVLNATTPPRSSRSPCSASMKRWLSMMPVSGERIAATQASSGSSRLAAAPSMISTPSTLVDPGLLDRSLRGCASSRVAGGDDELAAFAVRHAVGGAEIVEHPPRARAVIARASSRSDNRGRRG